MNFHDVADSLHALVGSKVSATVSVTDDVGENIVAVVYGVLERAPEAPDDVYYVVLEEGGTGVFLRKQHFVSALAQNGELVVGLGPVTVTIKETP